MNISNWLRSFKHRRNSALINPLTSSRSITTRPAVTEQLERRRLLSLTVPAYSSRPSAAKTIFLDFDGTAAFQWTTGTDSGGSKTYTAHGPGGSTVPIPAFTIDSDATSFSSKELGEINQIFQWVAEKYSPFDVNVTTVDPGNRTHGVVEQCIIGGSANDWLQDANAAGISAIGGFTNPSLSNSCFMFSADIASKSENYRVHVVGEDAAHEVGHSMGLYHQRTPGNNYYPGDSTRAPIMGGSNFNFTGKGIWWKTNNWPGQNSTDAPQDDLGVMTAAVGGPLSYRVDDYASAGSLTLNGDNSFAPAYGVIERSTDTDSFNFTPPTASASFTVNNASLGGMLTPQVFLFDPATNQGVSSTYTNSSTQATVASTTLTPGHRYQVIVEGSGQYGDIGQYSLSGTATGFAKFDGTSQLNISGQTGTNNVTVSVEYNGANNPGLLQVSDSVNGASPGVQTFPINSIKYIVIDLPGSGNSIHIKPLYPLYTGGETGGPSVIVDGHGTDRLTLDMADSTGSFTAKTAGVFRQITFVSTEVDLSGGFNSITLIGGTENANVFNISDWDHTLPLTLNGANGYSNQFNFDGDDFDPNDPVYTLIGSSNSTKDAITVDASALGGPLSGSVTNTNFSLGNSGTVLEGAIFLYSNIESINITATASADKLNVYSLPATTSLFFHGGAGNDTVTLGYAAGSISLDNVLGNVYFYGDGGNDTGVLDDAFNAYGRTYVGDHTHIGTTGGANLFNAGSVESLTINAGSGTSTYSIYEGQPGVTLVLNGGAGADTFNFSNGTYWNAYIYGNGGLNTLNVDDRNGASSPYRTDIRDQSVTHYYGSASSPSAYAIYYSNIGSASYYGAPTTNLINVLSTSADIASGYQWSVVSGSGNDSINVYPHNTFNGTPTLLGAIGILGGGGTDTVTFDDSATPVAVDYHFVNLYGSSTANILGLGGPGVGVANDMENIVVLGTALNDEFDVDTFKSGSSLTLNGNGGNDTCDLASGSKELSGSFAAVPSFTFNGGAANDVLNIHSDNSTGAWTFYQTPTSVVAAKTGFSVNVTNSGVEAFSIVSGSGNDSFLIQNPTGTTTTANAGGGLNSMYVAPGGNVLFNASQTFSSLSLDTNASATVASNGNLVVRTNNLTVYGNSKLDLSNNTLILDYTGASPSATVLGYLTAGRNGGAWNGATGIVSSAVAGVTNSSLGYAEASTAVGPTGGTFAGQSVDSTAVLIRFTLLGDTNLDRKVDIVDLGNLSSHWQSTVGDWSQGDFDYNGKVDIVDLGLLSSDWQKGYVPPAVQAVRPVAAPVKGRGLVVS